MAWQSESLYRYKELDLVIKPRAAPTLFICFILFSWVFNLSTSSKALFRRTSTLLWTAAACFWDLFRFSISYTEHSRRSYGVIVLGNNCSNIISHVTLGKCSETLFKADTCSCRPSHFLADSSAKALCFSICVCWMLVVLCSLALSSSVSFIFAFSWAFSSSCSNTNDVVSK